MRLLWAGVVMGLAGACALPADGTSPIVPVAAGGQISDAATGEPMSEADLFGRLRAADYVLIGEDPPSPAHPAVEAQLIRVLAEAPGELGAVVLQMIRTDSQQVLTESLDEATGVGDGLGAMLDWPGSGWPDFAFYRPMLDAALVAGAEIVAASPTEAQEEGLRRQGFGVLPRGLVRRAGLERPLPASAQLALSQALAARQCGSSSPGTIAGLVREQRGRDALMAERLVRVSGRERGLLIARAIHVRWDWGVPRYIAAFRPDAKIVSLLLTSDTLPAPEINASRRLAFDVVWSIPTDPAAEADRCGVLGGPESGIRTAQS